MHLCEITNKMCAIYNSAQVIQVIKVVWNTKRQSKEECEYKYYLISYYLVQDQFGLLFIETKRID